MRSGIAIGPCLGATEKHDLDVVETDIPLGGDGDLSGQWRGRRIYLGPEVVLEMDLDVVLGEHHAFGVC